MEISLTKWREEDAEDFFLASQDVSLYANMSDAFPKTREECRRVVLAFSAEPEKVQAARAIWIDGRLAGCIAAFFGTGLSSQNAELAYWLAKDFRGRGIMPLAIRLFTEELFSRHTVHRVWAAPFERNSGSRRALEKAGFLREGLLRESAWKDGAFLNTVLYSLVKS